MRNISSNLLNSIDSELKRIRKISFLAYRNIKFESKQVLRAYKLDNKIPKDYVNVFLKKLKDSNFEDITEYAELSIEYGASFYPMPDFFKSSGFKFPESYRKYLKK